MVPNRIVRNVTTAAGDLAVRPGLADRCGDASSEALIMGMTIKNTYFIMLDLRNGRVTDD